MTAPLGRIARVTVEAETPAARATSLIVTAMPDLHPRPDRPQSEIHFGSRQGIDADRLMILFSADPDSEINCENVCDVHVMEPVCRDPIG